jgi:hypothetical protein
MQVTPLLRERCFGSKLELTCHQNYCPAWEGDAADPASKPCGCEDGESVQEVSARVQQLFQVRVMTGLHDERGAADGWHVSEEGESVQEVSTALPGAGFVY